MAYTPRPRVPGLRAYLTIVIACAAILGLLIASLAFEAPKVVEAAPKLDVTVNPLVTFAPGNLHVRIKVAQDPDNRFVQVEVLNENIYRSSLIQLDGADAKKFYDLFYRDLPGGETLVIVTVFNGQAKPWARLEKHCKIIEKHPSPDDPLPQDSSRVVL